jgi:PIN domain nuclease of toxin-antitoxin system
VAEAILAPGGELWLSPVSVWEVLLLTERKRLEVDGDPRGWIGDALSRFPVNEAPLTHDIALESRSVDVSHGDPADRFLAATAKVLDLTLVTADRRLFGLKSCSVLANR